MDSLESRRHDWQHQHEQQLTDERPIRFDLFVRSLGSHVGSHRRQAAILERIERFEERDIIDSVQLTVWGDSVCVSECCAERPAVRATRDRVEQFNEWAQQRASISTPFERREVRSSITDEQYAVVDLPTICLAVYVDTSLDAVVPASIDGEHRTVSWYLDWFERVQQRADETILLDA